MKKKEEESNDYMKQFENNINESNSRNNLILS